MIIYIDDVGHILDIKELTQLRKDYTDFHQDLSNDELRSKYFDSLICFFEWYINYSSVLLKGKIFDDKQISECVFKDIVKNEAHLKEFLLKHIYISREYVKFLKETVKKNKVHVYKHTLSALETDLEWLLSNVEIYYKKTTDKITSSSWRSKNLKPRDIYWAALSLFRIEEFDNIEQIYLRDLKPVVMFQIRQLLEVFGKNLIGYDSITDDKGDDIKKFTQVAWAFIKSEVEKPNSRIKFSFNINIILEINGWANSFVHTTHIYSSYIQHFALNAIKVLFVSPSPSSSIKMYNGITSKKLDISDIRISDYNSLKLDFESYLKEKISTAVVSWQPIDNAGAYIISL